MRPIISCILTKTLLLFPSLIVPAEISSKTLVEQFAFASFAPFSLLSGFESSCRDIIGSSIQVWRQMIKNDSFDEQIFVSDLTLLHPSLCFRIM